jgi:uncharacterized protein (DUF1501 family)
MGHGEETCTRSGLLPGSTQRAIALHAQLVAAVRAREVPRKLLAADFSMENRVAAAIDYTYRGPCGWREWMNDLFEAFADGARFDARELIAVGDDFVAATFCVVGRSVWSGNRLELSWAGVTWFRAEQATRVAGYSSKRAALVATQSQSRTSPYSVHAPPIGPPEGAP